MLVKNGFVSLASIQIIIRIGTMRKASQRKSRRSFVGGKKILTIALWWQTISLIFAQKAMERRVFPQSSDRERLHLRRGSHDATKEKGDQNEA